MSFRPPLLYNLMERWEMNQVISSPVSDVVSSLKTTPSKTSEAWFQLPVNCFLVIYCLYNEEANFHLYCYLALTVAGRVVLTRGASRPSRPAGPIGATAELRVGWKSARQRDVVSCDQTYRATVGCCYGLLSQCARVRLKYTQASLYRSSMTTQTNVN